MTELKSRIHDKCTSFMLRAMLARSLTVLHGKAPPCPFSERAGLLETV